MSQFIGNFHKSLPHNEFGEVKDESYKEFESICNKIEAGIRPPIDFEDVPAAKPPFPDAQSPFAPKVDPELIQNVARLTSPLAAAATEAHGPDPKTLNMCPPPDIRSLSALAEMVELYWMALLRDLPLQTFQNERVNGIIVIPDPRVNSAIEAIKTLFDAALQHDTDLGRLLAPLDLTVDDDGVDIRLQTLFRTGLQGEEFGPLVSQFFIRPIGYGTQTIDQRIVPYIAGKDFLTTHGDWLLAQNTGKDRYGRSYGSCNNYADQINPDLDPKVMYYPTLDGNPKGEPIKRYISTMRDLARFVNRDALHQAYFNAALFLAGIGAPLDKGNPYRKDNKLYTREDGFATLGDPDLLTLVSEVASRALKVVWRQKWLVHRRCRPEVFGGLLQMQINGYNDCNRDYGLLQYPNDAVKEAVEKTLDAVKKHNGGTFFLPMAFSAGSPNHPAYGAGHATVAGACVTILKAWFDEDAKLKELFDNAKTPKDPPLEEKLMLLQPGNRRGEGLEDFCDPQEYQGDDADCMTIGGELNKLASNVAMGRSMGGVHWRSDNTRSLRLGEDIAIEILRKRTLEYAEKPVCFTFCSFDRKKVHISDGRVERCD